MTHSVRFVIDGFPRSGTTTLTNLLNLHPDIQCCMEPFHPSRYGGHFHMTAIRSGIPSALQTILPRWNSLKHVWEPSTAWPFIGYPQLNDALVLEAPVVVSMRRRNLLRQYVSGHVSRHLSFWVGTKMEFQERLRRTQLPPLTIDGTRQALEQMTTALERRESLFNNNETTVHTLFYEDIFQHAWKGEAMADFCNSLYQTLGFTPLQDHSFRENCQRLFDPDRFMWASESVYAMIPNSQKIDDLLGNCITGRLFT